MKTLLSYLTKHIFLLVIAIGSLSAKMSNIFKFNEFFVGREEQIQQIFQLFENENNKVVSIVGIRGIGKTQLAKQFIKRAESQYDILWWIDVKDDTSAQFDIFVKNWNIHYGDLYGKINPQSLSDERKNSIILKLRDSNLKSLIILDNAPNYKRASRYIIDNLGGGKMHYLITTTNDLGWFSKLKLGSFSLEESTLLVKKCIPSAESKDTETLHKTLNGYPLSITKFISYIHTYPTTNFSDLIKKLESNEFLFERDSFSGESTEVEDGYNHSSRTVIDAALTKIKSSKPAYTLLKFISVLSSQDIPVSLLRSYYEKYCGKKGYSFEEAIKTIMGFSLLDFGIFDKAKNAQYLSIHELVQREIFCSMGKEELKNTVLSALELLANPIRKTSNTGLPYKEEGCFLNHIKKVMEIAQKFNIANDDFCLLNLFLAEHALDILVEPKSARELIDRLLTTMERRKIDSDFVIGKTHFIHAKILIFLGEYAKSIEFFQKAKATFQKTKEGNGEYLRCVVGLVTVSAYLSQEDIYMAHMEEIDKVRKSTPLPTVLEFGVNRAKALYHIMKGQFNEAQVYLSLMQDPEKYVAFKKQSLYVDIIQIYVDLRLKNNTAVIQAAEQLLARYDLETSDRDYFAGVLRLAFAETYYNLGEINKAEKNALFSTKILKNFFDHKDVHFTQSLALVLLAKINIKKGNFKDAYKQLKKAISIYVHNGYNIKNFYETEELYRTMIYLLTITNNFYQRAEVLKEINNIYGENHPFTNSILKLL